MKNVLLRWGMAVALLALALIVVLGGRGSRAQAPPPRPLVAGVVRDPQNQPVEQAEVTLRAPGQQEPLAEAVTQANGRYALPVPEEMPDALALHVERPHFEQAAIELDAAQVADLQGGGRWSWARSPWPGA